MNFFASLRTNVMPVSSLESTYVNGNLTNLLTGSMAVSRSSLTENVSGSLVISRDLRECITSLNPHLDKVRKPLLKIYEFVSR